MPAVSSNAHNPLILHCLQNSASVFCKRKYFLEHVQNLHFNKVTREMGSVLNCVNMSNVSEQMHEHAKYRFLDLEM